MNKDIANIFNEMAKLLEIKGDSAFRINAYKKSVKILEFLQKDIGEIYKEHGLKGVKEIGVGEKNAKKIEEYIKSALRHGSGQGKIKVFEQLQEETAIRQIVTHFFESKGLSLQELKENAKKRKIIYSRFTKPAKQLLELAGSIDKSKEAINKVATWANSRKLDYTIETVFKKWLELDRLKPKEIVKKPFYKEDPMVWSETKRKWYVISKHGEWLLFADKESEIEWKTIE
ncbi:MAG: hypothetical protein A2639_01560 [Candidatus Staskawiczbacteria bacterium RIFCSPHIGHO2_01_FULL_34_27]|uniref:Crossover junction endonuclease MUS81-like HHH domain-containing protein n=1 Tax=Candidatus Staskawiczbacteria bacterium RIFCSPHIGHO2_01_FULL_34_27 TaxID=1802199 RepID=A0A1G2HM40_9BACT|nr:MAG: hypothetical protein A2639_01560 [Candidatus Staskawiczbacteria bacterium RIFCSPHIGHO2_01_FULL_34_27]